MDLAANHNIQQLVEICDEHEKEQRFIRLGFFLLQKTQRLLHFFMLIFLYRQKSCKFVSIVID